MAPRPPRPRRRVRSGLRLPRSCPHRPPLAAGDFSSVDASELADLHADAAAHDVPPPVLTVPDQGAPMHQRQHDDDVAYDADAAEDRDAAHGADADDDRDASYGAADDADYQSGADDDDYQYGAYGDEGRQDGIPEDDIEAEDAVDAEDDIDAHIEEPEDIPDAAGYEAGKSRATTLMKHRPWSEVQPAQTKERNGCNMTSETGPTGSRIDSEPPWMSLSAINPISRRPNCYTTTFSSTS
ncbi:hypothetical protein MHU86_25347 [Fragilaria crotonensis]|nr:hypothetical protein MHU86_25347 [Fragilaria crotonensis]